MIVRSLVHVAHPTAFTVPTDPVHELSPTGSNSLLIHSSLDCTPENSSGLRPAIAQLTARPRSSGHQVPVVANRATLTSLQSAFRLRKASIKRETHPSTVNLYTRANFRGLGVPTGQLAIGYFGSLIVRQGAL